MKIECFQSRGIAKILSLYPIFENYKEMKRYIINNIDDTY